MPPRARPPCASLILWSSRREHGSPSRCSRGALPPRSARTSRPSATTWASSRDAPYGWIDANRTAIQLRAERGRAPAGGVVELTAGWLVAGGRTRTTPDSHRWRRLTCDCRATLCRGLSRFPAARAPHDTSAQYLRTLSVAVLRVGESALVWCCIIGIIRVACVRGALCGVLRLDSHLGEEGDRRGPTPEAKAHFRLCLCLPIYLTIRLIKRAEKGDDGGGEVASRRRPVGRRASASGSVRLRFTVKPGYCTRARPFRDGLRKLPIA